MFLLFSLCFKVFLPDEYKNIHFNKQKKLNEEGTINCQGQAILVERVFTNRPDKYNYFYCDNQGRPFYFKNVNCSNFQINYNTNSKEGRLIFVQKVNITIEKCNFDKVDFYYNLIHGKDDLNQNNKFKFEMTSCNINNCCQLGPFTTLLNSEYLTTIMKENSVYYDPNPNLDIRAFLVHVCTGCTFIGNKVVNAHNNFHVTNENDHHVEDSSGFLTYRNKDNSLPLIFEDCTFINCEGVNPSVVSLQNITQSFTVKHLTFENLQNSLDREGYIFFINCIHQCTKLTLQDCVFRNIECDSRAGGGIGLLFRRDVNLTLDFIGCVFENITHTNTEIGGGAICFRNDNSNRRTNVNVKGCKFENIANLLQGSSVSGRGGAIYFDSVDYKINIEGSSFKNTSARESHAIYIANIKNDDKYIINACTFTDCGQGENQYCITLDATKFEFLDSTINFSDPAKSCKCFQIVKCTNHLYRGNTFQNFKCITTCFVINVNPNAKITIENNTFDHIEGNMNGRCICVNSATSSLTFSNNTFQNCPSGGSLVYFSFTDTISMFVVQECRFIKNTYKSNSDPLILINFATPIKYSLKFQNCLFECNYSPDFGGAIFYDQNYLSFIFVECTFTNNTAKNGGAIYINNNNEVQIRGCTFCGNSGEEGSGSIFIDKTSKSIEISECTFNKNTESSSINTISFGNDIDKTLSIFNCTFTDSSAKEYVIDIPGKLRLAKFESNTIEFSETKGCGGIRINQHNSYQIDIRNIIFKSTDVFPAISLISKVGEIPINIEYCVFESCKSDTYTFDFDIYTTLFCFKNSVVTNVECTNDQSYIGRINIYKDNDKLVLDNISFIDNKCSSLFGGGTGLKIENILEIEFINCKFIGNEARQSKTTSRPSTPGIQYYNGDGGGIQLGYICWMNNIKKLTFNECVFERNKASRHGGAIAIQPIVNVEIRNCEFTGNEANYNFDSSSELLENHFHKKKDGRGGAIYINTNYYYDDKLEPDCPSDQEKTLENIVISNCTFTKNNGFDGYAMYVEGDSIKSNFAFTSNKFIDNYNSKNHKGDETIIYGAVIVTEVETITKESLEGNNFEYSSDIKVNNLSLVDHYGNTPSIHFSESNDFTFSRFFTKSGMFTETNVFSETGRFSLTNKFTESNDFSASEKFYPSNIFSESNDFSASVKFHPSNKFTESDDFSASGKFSTSSIFSESDDFSASGKFHPSNIFSESDDFSASRKFYPSNIFTESNDFSASGKFHPSNIFSESNDFSASRKFHPSNKFTESDDFSASGKFHPSNLFTESNDFSASGKFHPSNKFTESNDFSETGRFSLTSKFTESNDFSASGKFHPSNIFTESNDFSASGKFHPSNIFTESNDFSETGRFSLTSRFTESNDFSASGKFHPSNKFTESNDFSASGKFSFTNKFSETNYFSASIQFSHTNLFTKSEEFSPSQISIESSEQTFSSNEDYSSVSEEESSSPSNEDDSSVSDEESSSPLNEDSSSVSDEGESFSSNEDGSSVSDEESSSPSNEDSSSVSDEGESFSSNEDDSSVSDGVQSFPSNENDSSYPNEGESSPSHDEQPFVSNGGESLHFSDEQSSSATNTEDIVLIISERNDNGSPSNEKQSKKIKLPLILGIVFGILAVIIVTIIAIFIIRRKKYETHSENKLNDLSVVDNKDHSVTASIESENPLFNQIDNDPFDEDYDE